MSQSPKVILIFKMSQSEKDVFVSPKSGVSEDQIANSSSTTMENSVKDENSIDRHEYLSGLKLFAVMTSITLASFLMLLDSSIVGTVSTHQLIY